MRSIERKGDSDLYDVYGNNQLTSFSGIFLWIVICFFAYLFIVSIKSTKTDHSILFISLSVEVFILSSWQMNYFQVSKNHFRILKHNLFWKKTLYNLSDIQEIVFESNYKGPNSLRVITTDFTNKYYFAATLNSKSWLDLKDKLESYNILVTDKRRQK